MPISVLLISVTMCEIARHSQLVCFNSVTGNNVCARPRACVYLTAAYAPSVIWISPEHSELAQSLSTHHTGRVERSDARTSSRYFELPTERIHALSFDYDLAKHTEETSWRWREGEALGSAPCWIRCFNTWWERKKEIVCGLCFSNLCVKIGYDAQLSD